MKTRIAILLIFGFLLTSCGAQPATPEVKVASPVPTAAKATMTAAPVVTQKPTATESPTHVPGTTTPSCVTLLTPLDGAQLPALGRITFSWDPRPEALSYALNIVMPSGQTVSFETQETSREQYIDVFSAAGQYQWKVIAQDRKRQEICSSEFATGKDAQCEQEEC